MYSFTISFFYLKLNSTNFVIQFSFSGWSTFVTSMETYVTLLECVTNVAAIISTVYQEEQRTHVE